MILDGFCVLLRNQKRKYTFDSNLFLLIFAQALRENVMVAIIDNII
jgi:hypothetical protein